MSRQYRYARRCHHMHTRPVATGARRNTLIRQAGLSLIELMISMILGLIIIAAVFNMYTGNSRSAQFTEGLQSMQENGRYGISVLQRGLRLAGFSTSGHIDAFDFSKSGDSAIAIRSEQTYDCNGALTTATGGVAVNTYRHDQANNQLTCEGNQAGAVAMPIVDDVEHFRVLYGIDSDGDDSSSEPQRYVPFATSIDPSEVVALRFALLVNSGSPIRSRAISETYIVLDDEVNLTDRMAREVFSSTVKLRNRQ